jgi:polysaccharide pyruvyl transferase WcaK-like protein
VADDAATVAAGLQPAAPQAEDLRLRLYDDAPMMDLLLELWVALLIEATKVRHVLGYGQAWRPGTPLKLLFAGYNGNRNTGADVRVEEMIRQVRYICGDEHLELSILTCDPNLSRGYFANTKQVHIPNIFPPFLYRQIRKYDGVVACEGSMFKSKFANALTTMMIGALGHASAQRRFTIGYGAEAGHMDWFLRRMCARYCRLTPVITRNKESQSVLGALGIRTELGADTAWTFEPHPATYADSVLKQAGWDGHTPILGVCPINPFWWPVRPSLVKWLLKATTGRFADSHNRSIYFHHQGPGVDAAFERYLTAIANAVTAFRQQHAVFPIMIGMEMLDRRACEVLAKKLGGAPVFNSDQYDMYQLVSILRRCSLLVSSRFHGIVTCMPGLVASCGVTMDERIRNLMHERRHPDLLLEVDDPELEPKLLAILQKLHAEAERIRTDIGAAVVRNLRTMARMGVYFLDYLQHHYPEFPARRGCRSWEEFLPPLSPHLESLVEKYDEE